MMGQMVISFREGLEALLLVAMLIMYLKRTGRSHLVKSAVFGSFVALVIGSAIAATVMVTYGGLGDEEKKLFEILASFLAVVVLTYMVYWMATKGKEIKKEVERKAESKGMIAIAALAFIFVVREVVETVLFLVPFATRDVSGTVGGLIGGVVLAAVITYGIYTAGLSFDLRRFFYYSSLLLILVAGGLVGYGVHEFIEYSGDKIDFGWLASPVYDLKIDNNSPFHHKGVIGSIFAVLFGYTVKAEWLRLIVHWFYLAIAIPLVLKAYSVKEVRSTAPIEKTIH